MDWNGNYKPFVSRPDNSLSFLYNYNYDHYPGTEMKHQMVGQVEQHGVIPVAVPVMEMNNNNNNNSNYVGNIQEMMKKKRLSSEQLESLESSFQEEIKLDPDRKMKLANELGLQPRQISVWFQNRRARWKSKQLECLYDALKQEFDLVSREKQKLQEEVLALRSILQNQASKKQASTTVYTEISGEETVESTSDTIRISRNNNNNNSQPNRANLGDQNGIGDGNYVLNVEDYNPMNVMPPPSNYWPILPSYPSI